MLHLLTAGLGTTRTSRSPLDMSVHWGEAVTATSRLKRRERPEADTGRIEIPPRGGLVPHRGKLSFRKLEPLTAPRFVIRSDWAEEWPCQILVNQQSLRARLGKRFGGFSVPCGALQTSALSLTACLGRTRSARSRISSKARGSGGATHLGGASRRRAYADVAGRLERRSGPTTPAAAHQRRLGPMEYDARNYRWQLRPADQGISDGIPGVGRCAVRRRGG